MSDDSISLKWGRRFFLAGIALLIVRNNSYPWPVKRASDILFFLAAIAAAIFVLRGKNFDFFKSPLSKKVFGAFALVFLGIFLAAASGYLFDGIKMTLGGILEVGRFAEAALMLLLVGFFGYSAPGFYKKIALFQLSTLVYIFALPWAGKLVATFPETYRFQLFENWASNIGYYLVPSLSLVFAALLFRMRKPLLIAAGFFVCVGLFGILIWTQSRAALLGIFFAFISIIIIWARKNPKKLAAGIMLAIILPSLGFMILPDNLKNSVLGRFFPGIFQTENVSSAPTQETLEKIVEKELEFQIKDQRRFYLWNIYASTALKRPLGLGPSYDPQNIVGAPQGPHNTVLEYLVLGGLPALLGILILFNLGIKNLWQAAKNADDEKRFWPIYVSASLFGLIIASMFDNMSTFRLLWIILGMGIFLQNQKKLGD